MYLKPFIAISATLLRNRRAPWKIPVGVENEVGQYWPGRLASTVIWANSNDVGPTLTNLGAGIRPSFTEVRRAHRHKLARFGPSLARARPTLVRNFGTDFGMVLAETLAPNGPSLGPFRPDLVGRASPAIGQVEDRCVCDALQAKLAQPRWAKLNSSASRPPRNAGVSPNSSSDGVKRHLPITSLEARLRLEEGA